MPVRTSWGLVAIAMAMSTGGIIAMASPPAGAATMLTVVNCNDSGSGSLRDAVATANANPGDTIQFEAQCSVVTLTSGAINLAANMTISGPGASALAVSGGGQSQVFTISAGATVSISGLTVEDGHAGTGSGTPHFSFPSPFPPVSELMGRPLIGSGANGGNGGNGGGISNAGTLTVSDSTVSGNSAGPGGGGGPGGWLLGNGGNGGNGGTGGGIYNSGTLTVIDSTISGNTAGAGGSSGGAGLVGAGGNGGSGGVGGGIFNAGTGTLTVTGDTVSGDVGGSGGAGGAGGLLSGSGGRGGNGGSAGIDNEGTLNGSGDTIAANTGGGGGGGGGSQSLVNGIAGSAGSGGSGGISNAGVLIVFNSTLSGNAGGHGGTGGSVGGLFGHSGNGGNGGNGGGIDNQSQELTVSNTTLSGNTPGGAGAHGSVGSPGTAGASGQSGTGGGIHNLGSAVLTADIFAGSPAADCAGAPPGDGGYNVADDASCGFGGAGEGVSDGQIDLSPLQNNGGPTQTEAIGGLSVAATIEATGCPSVDQRGTPRPATGCSAGAFQVLVIRSTTTGLRLSSPSVLYGSETTETITGTVVGQSGSGQPEGTVNVVNGTTTLCGNASLTPGTSDTATFKCTLSATELPVGTYDGVEATFVPGTPSSSDSGVAYTTSTSTPRTLTVNSNVLSTTTSLTLSSPSALYGSENTETISGSVVGTVGDGQPVGTVTVMSGSTTLCAGVSLAGTAAGTSTYSCKLSATQLAAGPYENVEATYLPGTPSSSRPKWTYTTSSSPAGTTLTVYPTEQPTTTSLNLSVPSVPFGFEDTETLGGTVSGPSGNGHPEGTVNVVSGSTTLCSGVTLTPQGSDTAAYICVLSPDQLLEGTYDDVEATYVPGTPSSSNANVTYFTSTSASGTSLTVTPTQ